MRALNLVLLVWVGGAVLVLAPAAAVCSDGTPVTGRDAPRGDAWAVLPLDRALEEPALESALGLVLSGQDLLVVAGPERAEALGSLAASRGGEVGFLGSEPALRLWTSVGVIPEETAREIGINVIHRSHAVTLFRADLDRAYRLLEQGFFISEATLRPIADLKREHFGAGLTDRLLEARPLTQARQRFIKGLAVSVSADTLRQRIRHLSYDDGAETYRSRFAPRNEVRQQITPFLRDLLAAYVVPHGGTVEVEEFRPLLPAAYRGDDSVFANVIASKAGRKTSAHYIVCAHYDAISSRDPAWQASEDAWMSVAAPGADDNATGTAVLLETARLVSELDLDVGLTFVAFSGEELGLLGSAEYVRRLAPSDSMIGVINLDMLGYVQGGKHIALAYDLRSRWLSDLLDQTAEALDLESTIGARDFTGLGGSDHASFWSVGTPAVMLADRQDSQGLPLYPAYHTLADTLGGALEIDQVRENAELVVGFLARFAESQEETLCDISLTEGSVHWSWDGGPYIPLVAGDSVWVTLRAVNLGGSMITPEAYRFRVLLGDAQTGLEIAYQTLPVEALAGEYAVAGTSWQVGSDLVGEVMYSFSLEPLAAGVESDLANNSVTARLYVMPPATVLRGLHTYPNPVTDPADANLSFEIWHPYWQGREKTFTGQVDVWIYDLEGSRVGGGRLLRTLVGDKDIALGENSVALRDLLPDGADLPPGLYLCFAELKVTGGAGTVRAKTKFAVAR